MSVASGGWKARGMTILSGIVPVFAGTEGGSVSLRMSKPCNKEQAVVLMRAKGPAGAGTGSESRP